MDSEISVVHLVPNSVKLKYDSLSKSCSFNTEILINYVPLLLMPRRLGRICWYGLKFAIHLCLCIRGVFKLNWSVLGAYHLSTKYVHKTFVKDNYLWELGSYFCLSFNEYLVVCLELVRILHNFCAEIGKMVHESCISLEF